MELDKKALNLEMLKIAGFTCTGGIWTYPDGVDVDNGVPFFPDDETACFKWIVPKLFVMGYWLQLKVTPSMTEVWISAQPELAAFSYVEKTPALAFCLAVEELILSLRKD